MIVKKLYARPKNPSRIRWQPYDFSILAQLDHLRFADGPMLYAMVKRYHPELTYDTFKHRLHALWRNGYIARPPEQLALQVKNDSYYLIHCLTEEGAYKLCAYFNRDLQQTTWKLNQDRLHYQQLEHQLGISRFRAAVTLANGFLIRLWLMDRQCQRDVKYRIHDEHHERLVRELFSGRVNGHSPIEGEMVKQKLIPDSFFILNNHGVINSYALEYDMGTQNLKTMSRKYLGYYAMMRALHEIRAKIKQGKATEDAYPVFNGHPLKNLRVLTVTRDETNSEKARKGLRIKHLRECVRRLDFKKANGNKQGPGLKAFWFTSEDQYSWQEPGSMLQPIWQTTEEGESYSLLD